MKNEQLQKRKELIQQWEKDHQQRLLELEKILEGRKRDTDSPLQGASSLSGV